MNMKRWMTAAVIAATMASAGVARAEAQLGYVQLQRAIFEVNEGKRAKAKLTKAFQKKQAELTKKEAELKKLQDALKAKVKPGTAPDEATRAQMEDFRNRLMSLQQTFMSEQKSLQQEEQKLVGGIMKKMKKVIEKIGKSGKYTAILEVSDNGLLYAKPHLDLTNEVIRAYNKQHK